MRKIIFFLFEYLFNINKLKGPSGSGKTTLLDTLADRKKHKSGVRGKILLNGVPRTSLFKRVIGYVTQHECLIGTLTVRETLRYAADLRLPSDISSEEKEQRVI